MLLSQNQFLELLKLCNQIRVIYDQYKESQMNADSIMYYGYEHNMDIITNKMRKLLIADENILLLSNLLNKQFTKSDKSEKYFSDINQSKKPQLSQMNFSILKSYVKFILDNFATYKKSIEEESEGALTLKDLEKLIGTILYTTKYGGYLMIDVAMRNINCPKFHEVLIKLKFYERLRSQDGQLLFKQSIVPNTQKQIETLEIQQSLQKLQGRKHDVICYIENKFPNDHSMEIIGNMISAANFIYQIVYQEWMEEQYKQHQLLDYENSPEVLMMTIIDKIKAQLTDTVYLKYLKMLLENDELSQITQEAIYWNNRELSIHTLMEDTGYYIKQCEHADPDAQQTIGNLYAINLPMIRIALLNIIAAYPGLLAIFELEIPLHNKLCEKLKLNQEYYRKENHLTQEEENENNPKATAAFHHTTTLTM